MMKIKFDMEIDDKIIDMAIDRAREKGGLVAVVSCKDCMFWQRDNISCEGYAMCQTGEGGLRFRREYDFCSRAERRE